MQRPSAVEILMRFGRQNEICRKKLRVSEVRNQFRSFELSCLSAEADARARVEARILAAHEIFADLGSQRRAVISLQKKYENI